MVIGNGNVALDVARILSKTPAEFAGSDIVGHAFSALGDSAIRDIHVLGRRGPHQIAMTPKELGELGHLEDAAPQVDPADFPPEMDDALLEPGQRKSVTHLRELRRRCDAAKPKTIDFDFFAMPVRIEGDGKVERIIVEKTALDEQGAARRHRRDLRRSRAGWSSPASATRRRRSRACPMRTTAAASPISEGVIGDGLYCVGWARRGPTGTIGTNRPDGYEVAEKIAADLGGGGRAQGGPAGARPAARQPRRRHRHLPRLAADRGGGGGARARRAARARSSSLIEEMLQRAALSHALDACASQGYQARGGRRTPSASVRSRGSA